LRTKQLIVALLTDGFAIQPVLGDECMMINGNDQFVTIAAGLRRNMIDREFSFVVAYPTVTEIGTVL
jgi:hypothetical protein